MHSNVAGHAPSSVRAVQHKLHSLRNEQSITMFVACMCCLDTRFGYNASRDRCI